MWRTSVWQVPKAPQSRLLVQLAAVLLQTWTTVRPGQSPSQASPRPSWSEFLCRSTEGRPLKFGVRTQLSRLSTTPSASRSVVELEQTKPWPRDLSQVPLAGATQSASARQRVRVPPVQVPAWSEL